MFTGLIEEVGRILRVESDGGIHHIAISSPKLASQLKTGDSIAVSGVCLTALNVANDSFSADLAAETVARTSLAYLSPGSLVNLELPTRAGAPLGGHVVQGHVDAAGRLAALRPVQEDATGPHDWWLEVEIPQSIEKYVVEKGSISIEGISLTVARIEPGKVTIAILPHTYNATNLHDLKPGDLLNIEVDVLARYAEQRAAKTPDAPKLTLERLMEQGF